jgi:cyclophilin family peptidyl-prolyl cis-trans isomerase
MEAQEPRTRISPLTLGVLVVAAVGAILTLYFVNRDNNAVPLATVITPSPPPIAAATPCDNATFGSQLAPLTPPSDLHVYAAPPRMTINTSKLYKVQINTSKGVINICLEPVLAPKTVNNFVTLARNGFYDGLKFYRVIPGQIIQGGDPTNDGSSGPGYKFADEPVNGSYVPGVVAMANAGPNTNGSDFFVTTGDDSKIFKPLYNLFGAVEPGSSGFSVAQKITTGDTINYVLVFEQK